MRLSTLMAYGLRGLKLTKVEGHILGCQTDFILRARSTGKTSAPKVISIQIFGETGKQLSRTGTRSYQPKASCKTSRRALSSSIQKRTFRIPSSIALPVTSTASSLTCSDKIC